MKNLLVILLFTFSMIAYSSTAPPGVDDDNSIENVFSVVDDVDNLVTVSFENDVLQVKVHQNALIVKSLSIESAFILVPQEDNYRQLFILENRMLPDEIPKNKESNELIPLKLLTTTSGGLSK